MRTLYAALLLLPACPSFADPITACPTTTFNVYISKYQSGCSVGGLIFSNFSMASYLVPPKGKLGAPDEITSDLITVSPVDQDNYIGLMFNASWEVAGVQEQITTFSFTVTAMPGVSIIGARATIAGQTAGSSINQAGFKDTLCPGGKFDKNGACVANGKFISIVDPFPTQNTKSETEMFTDPVTFVSANPRVRVTSIEAKGSASLVQATSEFQVTPEPSSFTLLFLGLAATFATRTTSRHA